MNEHKLFNSEETLQVIREVDKDPTLNQRILSKKLNISLGKTNYLLKELAKKGFIKIISFSKNPGKARKVRYLLTQKGFESKIQLTHHFLHVKEKEFENLKKEYGRMMEVENAK